MSLDTPDVAIVFGSVTPPQGDVVELMLHLGCTKEVSSFEVVLQNWSGKYSPNGSYPITVGLDGSISLGRGASCPQLITCRVENIKYQSSPAENYLTVSGRCWGERLFRRVVTATYENIKGEDIVKDLLDYYVGLSHSRSGAELIESTDTTYTKLSYSDTPVMDILREIAGSADKAGVIGYDYRVAPDGKFEFYPKNTKNSQVGLSERIEGCEYSKDITRVRNRTIVYGAADKSVPLDKDGWTEALSCSDGAWMAVSGSISQDTSNYAKGAASIKTAAQNLYYASSRFTLASGKEIDADQYPTLNLWLSRDASFNGNATIVLHDVNSNLVSRELTLGDGKWFQTQLSVGSNSADQWQIPGQFNWNQIRSVQVSLWFTGVGSGNFWVDGLNFGGRRYSSIQNDLASQNSIGLRELVDANEEYASDLQCESHAKALLANLKDPAETLSLQTTVLDYGNNPILAGDKIHVALPNEGVDSDFRVESVEYRVDGKTQTMQATLELGHEKPLLADYVYVLRSRTSSLSRYKTSKP
jgi:hypothetical protein